MYRVTAAVDAREVILSGKTDPQGCLSTLIAHRLTLICEGRHRCAFDVSELRAGIRGRTPLSFSLLIQAMTTVVDHVPGDGLLLRSVGRAQR